MSENQKCLIIEDSDVVGEIATRIVTELGLDVRRVCDAAEGVDMCGEFAPGVILLDWDLPAFGALDFLRGVDELYDGDKPAIVLCATENDPKQFALAKAAGAAYHTLKPFDVDSIRKSLIDAAIIKADDASVSSGDEPETSAAQG